MIINDEQLRRNSLIPLNFDLEEIRQFVPIAEDVWLRPILGTLFMEELQREVDDNNLTDQNGTLLVMAVWPFLGLAVTYECAPFAWLHWTETGLTLGKSDNSDSAGLKDITYFQAHVRSMLEARKEMLVKFLIDHASSFPLWEYEATSCGCLDYAIKCGCCQDPKLLPPNKLQFAWTTRRADVELR